MPGDRFETVSVHDGVIQSGGELTVRRSLFRDHGRAGLIAVDAKATIEASAATGGEFGLVFAGAGSPKVTTNVFSGSEQDTSGVQLTIPAAPKPIEIAIPND